jgi:hypothetical protein
MAGIAPRPAVFKIKPLARIAMRFKKLQKLATDGTTLKIDLYWFANSFLNPCSLLSTSTYVINRSRKTEAHASGHAQFFASMLDCGRNSN